MSDSAIHFVSRDPVDQAEFIALCEQQGLTSVVVESVVQLAYVDAPVVYHLAQMMPDERHWVLTRLAQPARRRPTVLLIAYVDLEPEILREMRRNDVLVAVGLHESVLTIAAAVRIEQTRARREAA